MLFISEPNLILEALCYLGLRANETQRQSLEDRLCSKGITDLHAFRSYYRPFQNLREELDHLVNLPQSTLSPLFTDVYPDGYQTSGCHSSPMLLLLPLACIHEGDFESFSATSQAFTPDQTARNILLSMDMEHLLSQTDQPPEDILLEYLTSSDLSKAVRVRLLQTQKNAQQHICQALPILQIVITALEQLKPRLSELTQHLASEVQCKGCERCLHEISSFRPSYPIAQMRPLIMDPATNLLLDQPGPDGSYTIYCGAMRVPLRHLQMSAQASLDQIYEWARLLGDRTRFEIFCYLRNHPSYNQELSRKFGLARNTIHHHMSQMFRAGLVNCTTEGTRVYYSIDNERYKSLLDQQKALFLDD